MIIIRMSCLSQDMFDDFMKETNPQVKAEMGIELWDYYSRNNVDTLELIGNELLINTDSLDFLGTAVGNGALGSYFFRVGDVRNCLKYMSRAIVLFKEVGIRDLLCDSYNELGNCMYAHAYYSQACSFFEEAIDAGQEAIDQTSIYSGCIGLGKSICALGDTVVGLNLVWDYCRMAKKDFKWEALSNASAYLAQICDEQGDQKLSESLYNLSIESAEKSSSRTHLANGLNNRAILLFNKGNYDSSLFYFRESLTLRNRIGKVKAISESYFNLGNFFWGRELLDSAEFYFRKAHSYASDNKLQADVVDALEDLATLYDKRGFERKGVIAQKELIKAREDLVKRANLNSEMLSEYLSVSTKTEKKTRRRGVLEISGGILLIVISLVFLREDRSNSVGQDTQA